MVYRNEVLNFKAVEDSVTRIEKRKGKAVPMYILEDGDLFRFPDKRLLYMFRRDRDGKPSVWDAWGQLTGYGMVGTGGFTKDDLNREVFLVATKGQYVQPKYKPAIATIVYPNSDGTCCCQNVIFSHAGQHFKLTKKDLDALAARDGDSRNWERSSTPCNCSLKVGWVKEYDGRVHKGAPIMRKNPEAKFDPWQRLNEAIRLEWLKACVWEGMTPEEAQKARFVEFSADNPYMKPGGKYARLMSIKLNALNNARHGAANPVEDRQYQGFHGNPPSRARHVKIPLPHGPLTAIGRAVRIEYEPYGNSRHVGTRFFHDFGDLGGRKIKERPILVADRDGNIFFVPQHSRYPHFSDRGILG